jgi:hypothetical protein
MQACAQPRQILNPSNRELRPLLVCKWWVTGRHLELYICLQTGTRHEMSSLFPIPVFVPLTTCREAPHFLRQDLQRFTSLHREDSTLMPWLTTKMRSLWIRIQNQSSASSSSISSWFVDKMRPCYSPAPCANAAGILCNDFPRATFSHRSDKFSRWIPFRHLGPFASSSSYSGRTRLKARYSFVQGAFEINETFSQCWTRSRISYQ